MCTETYILGVLLENVIQWSEEEGVLGILPPTIVVVGIVRSVCVPQMVRPARFEPILLR